MDNRVSEAVQSKEDRLRYHDNITENQLDNMLFEELVFRSKMLEVEKCAEIKNQLIAASFTAWQIRVSQGDKIGWNKYKNRLGLSDQKIDESDRKFAIETAMSIHRDLQFNKKKSKK